MYVITNHLQNLRTRTQCVDTGIGDDYCLLKYINQFDLVKNHAADYQTHLA